MNGNLLKYVDPTGNRPADHGEDLDKIQEPEVEKPDDVEEPEPPKPEVPEPIKTGRGIEENSTKYVMAPGKNGEEVVVAVPQKEGFGATASHGSITETTPVLALADQGLSFFLDSVQMGIDIVTPIVDAIGIVYVPARAVSGFLDFASLTIDGIGLSADPSISNFGQLSIGVMTKFVEIKLPKWVPDSATRYTIETIEWVISTCYDAAQFAQSANKAVNY